ncbi:hypothetical protein FH608_041480 [Nonomuraea phyllanthi]|uniref:Uncharacterized protein n=1 Tax=Nonomuraea phyllanthi TaxID=2219224 RepID=A0A5C4VH37_9ACTN|nr:hypothetical protein [Nonomuraea phyllanthi]KAB8188958.1 hypothetical protein FH608_041480 [Nonomuraea phyllanthi]QFY09523.1 hypothetical protein GBF35_25315 [Nonomuraea phyllanthi]
MARYPRREGHVVAVVAGVKPAVTPSPSTAGREHACDAGGSQALEVAVCVISYLAAAAAGG